MPRYLGIDTSNYTTSSAFYDSDSDVMIQSKKLLPVKEGELGLRQSDAVFHHTKQLPEVIEKLTSDGSLPAAIGVSVKPRLVQGSYMPCFLCGEGFARSFAALTGVKVYTTSHQTGHVLAALYSAGKQDLIHEKFLAFHVSGGTTDCLLCIPDAQDVLKITCIGTSLDLKAGQAVDRTGLMLGLKFPCGIELEKLAAQRTHRFRTTPVLKGNDCCLSGLENKCATMKKEGIEYPDIAGFCLDFIGDTIIKMTQTALSQTGTLPVVFAGGVMSDKLIKDNISEKLENGCWFASPEFSCDNAAGTALYAKIKQECTY
ncbi:MAG: peptidase M22 [Oscillospiraceae bacterium]|nr:peptidase M22 [Oscillospiraceae bacterium]